MSDVFLSAGVFLGLFLCSMLFSWIWFRIRRKRLNLPPPALHTRLVLRQGPAMLTARLMDIDERGWWISAPTLKSDILPIRPAEKYCVEYADEHGLTIFYAKVLERQAVGAKALLLEAPESVIRRDRRSHRRHAPSVPAAATIDEKTRCSVLNFSAGGACVCTNTPLNPGDEISLRLEDSAAAVPAWVLDCSDENRSSRARIVFQREIPAEFFTMLAEAYP